MSIEQTGQPSHSLAQLVRALAVSQPFKHEVIPNYLLTVALKPRVFIAAVSVCFDFQ